MHESANAITQMENAMIRDRSIKAPSCQMSDAVPRRRIESYRSEFQITIALVPRSGI
jgi:hypothetical protein